MRCAGGLWQRGSGSGASGFSSAAPEVKDAWDKAVAADKANDYVLAVLGYKQTLVQRDQLSASQVKAVEEASSKLFQRLVEGAAGSNEMADMNYCN
jgi:hypothetical protein